MTDTNKIVAVGTWLYDGTVPKQVVVYAKPARFASCRYDEDDQLDETRPIPKTKDGYLYFCFPGPSCEHFTIESAKACFDSQPWGPAKWN